MNPFKNLNKILLSLLVIVNLHVSFDHITSQNSVCNAYNIELLISKNKHEKNAINFKCLKQSISSKVPVISYLKNEKFEYKINIQNALDQLKHSTQKQSVLYFKSILLQIVINDISIQKSHCI